MNTDVKNSKPVKDKNDKIDLKSIIITLLIAIGVAFTINCFFKITVVSGISMNNTLYNGEKLLLNRQAYKSDAPKFGDIVVVERDDLAVKYIIKRVIGLPGDEIEIKDNQLFINGKEIKENYIKEPMSTEDLKIKIPEGKIFVMGDNRNNSLDSRRSVIGLIDYKNQVFGKVIYSLSEFKSI